MLLQDYINKINKRFKLGNATEHTFRGDLQQLFESLLPNVSITNEPKRQSCGAPDFIISTKNIPLGFIEAKDIGDQDLTGEKKNGNKEQFDRYKSSLNNIIFTDYLDFLFYRDGILHSRIAIGKIENGSIIANTEYFSQFISLVKDFSLVVNQTITNPKKLAEMMAGKAKLLAQIIERSVTSDESNKEDSTLKDQMHAFQEILIHDITPKGFADVYSQTIVYGLFAARLHDPTLPTFSRQEAAELIPKTNPFLRKLFGYIAGPDIDDRIRWIVDDLIEIFLACNVSEILKNYGKATKTEDPIIHFYETFLSEYDPKLRKTRGVWYTPKPVVTFIVRAVDDILKTEFNLPQGLVDYSKTKIKINLQETDKRYKSNIKTIDEEIHRVQILDPATGTGTFLAEVVKQIYGSFESQKGIWSNYVENHLIPRLNGFELLMASYAMAHLQLDLLLSETGYSPTKDQRFKIFLTNSLEEHHPDTGTLFANWLSSEANEANRIKRDTPVMCVLGNPPYSGESINKGDWIMSLMEDYKKEPGGKTKLKERNPKWINDDYVKFLRFGQHFIEKNGSGILAFINPHGYLDNPTFRGMRWNLMKTYDKIYTIDLHGNSNKKETAPDGSPDINVFDIQQGVSINIFIKTGSKKPSELAEVFHTDVFGKREYKNDFLNNNSLATIKFKKINTQAPMYYMVSKDFSIEKVYQKGFSINSLFKEQSMGITSGDDKNFIGFSKEELIDKFGIDLVQPIDYRVFDKRFIYYKTDLLARSRTKFMNNFIQPNYAMSLVRRSRSNDSILPFVTESIVDKCIISTLDNANIFPLYIYPEQGLQSLNLENQRVPNLNTEITDKFSKILNLPFVTEKQQSKKSFSPIDIFDYTYAILHSLSYRDKFCEFLKIDFPYVAYPTDATQFFKFVSLGTELRLVHLYPHQIKQSTSKYPIDGSNIIKQVIYKGNNVYINDTQYFSDIDIKTWEKYIGGYQPAQKWLKDRKGLTLSYEDILHYRNIIAALYKTYDLINQINDLYHF